MNTFQHIPRKLFHCTGSIIPFTYLLTDKNTILIMTTVFFLIDILVEFLRITGRLNLSLIETITKSSERKKLTGTFFFLLAAIVTIVAFPKEVAVASLLVLSFSDPAGSLVGYQWGRVRFLGKSFEGCTAFFVTSCIILYVMGFPLLTVAAVSLAATLTELFSTSLIDDNLSIPLVTALCLFVFTLF